MQLFQKKKKKDHILRTANNCIDNFKWRNEWCYENSLEESGLSGLLIEGVREAIKNNKVKEQRGGYLGMLLGALGASLLGNLLTSKEVMRAGEGTIRVGEGTIWAGQDF